MSCTIHKGGRHTPPIDPLAMNLAGGNRVRANVKRIKEVIGPVTSRRLTETSRNLN